MTGLPTLLVELDDGTDTWPHDITNRVRLEDGWETTRGRQNEFGEVQTGKLTLSLDNSDGRFTLGNPTYDVVIGQRIRLTETVGGTVSKRHTGYVEDWPQEWTSALANVAVSNVTSLDLLERLSRRDMPASMIQGEILLDKPIAYYTLGEPTGATSAGDTSGNGGAVLTQQGNGAAVSFGVAVGPTHDDLTAATFASGKYLTSAYPASPTTYAGTTVDAFVLTASGTGTPAIVDTNRSQLGIFVDPSGVALAVGGGSTVVTGTVNIANSATHHVAVTWDGTTLRLYVDGVADGSTALAGTPSLGVSQVGSATLTGTVAHAAFYGAALSALRIAAHASAGLNGATSDSSGARIGRLADYAHIPSGLRDLDTGRLASTGEQVGAGKILPTMQAVTQTEGGALFIAGDGSLTFHDRTRRVAASTGSAALALTVSDVEHGDLVIGGAKDYLINTVTGSRDGGAIQRAVDQPSVDAYDEYPDDMTLLVLTDAEVLDAITWRKSAYAQPLPRLSSVTIDLFTSPAALQEAVLGLELGDRITIASMPTQAPMAAADLLIEGVREAQAIGSWKVTFNTVPAALFHAWILDDPVYSVLDDTTILHY